MKQKDIIILIIPSFILIVAWIIFSIYHSSVASTITPTVSVQILPIQPTFDMDTVTKLKQRQAVTPVYETQAVAAPTPTPLFINVPGATPTASQTNIPANTPQGTAGGKLLP